MAKKNYRELTVGEIGEYGKRVSPMIRLNGLWLEEAGFHAGDPILVKCEEGKLIITQDRARTEMIEAEKAFMEAETKKLQASLTGEESIDSLNEMPERFRVYDKEPWHSRNLRIMSVDNYLVFYIPNHKENVVTVICVMYGWRDVDRQLMHSFRKC